MSSQPWMASACCVKGDDSVTQLRFSNGHIVGLIRLGVVFEQLLAMGRTPDEATDAELLGMVRAQKNYIPPKAHIEAAYAAALRREYTIFYARQVKQNGSQG